jgi:small subunit ribosomal protein S3
VKVWIYKGEIMEHDPMAVEKRLAEASEQSSRSGQRAPAPA